MKQILLSLLAISMFLAASAQKFPGLAQTPPMGWNSWNIYACDVNEKLVKEVAKAMVDRGLKDAGYEYVVIDDCWHGVRDSLGFITADPVKFPSGIKALSDYIHSLGLKFGIYSDAGWKTCGGRPGSRGYEFQDAMKYAQWGVDYLKYDWCETDGLKAEGAYLTMRDALYKAGRPILFSMCEWGNSKPWEWAAETGHMWRTTGDICNKWEGKISFGTWTAWSTMTILDMQDGLRQYAGPGHWNDPDMLEVGNKGLTLPESRAHFSLWCIIAAPLIAGNDVRSMSPEVHDILTNKDVIAIDQDSLGKEGWRFRAETGREIWVRELSGSAWAICVLNTGASAADLTTDWSAMSILKGEYTVRDVWAKKDLGTTRTARTDHVESHDVMLFRLTPVK
jgi:alpha-galactosidase